MSVDRRTADETTLRAGAVTAGCARPVAIALAALGAPLAFAAPAVASDHGPAHAENGHNEAPANGQPGEPAPAPAAAAGQAQANVKPGTQQHAGPTPAPASAASARAQVGNGSKAPGHASAEEQHSAGEITHGGGSSEAHAGGPTNPRSEAGAQNPAGGEGISRGHAHAGGEGNPQGRAHAGREGSAQGHAHAGGDASSRTGVTNHAGVRSEARHHGHSDDRRNRDRNAGGAGGNRNGGTTRAHQGADASGVARGPSDGRGFTDVKMRVQENAGDGHAVARVKASPELDAAIRAEARAAAREEIREHFRSRERTGAGNVRFVVKGGRIDRPATLRMLVATRENESPTTTPGLMDDREQGGAGNAFGHAHNRDTSAGLAPSDRGNSGGLAGLEGVSGERTEGVRTRGDMTVGPAPVAAADTSELVAGAVAPVVPIAVQAPPLAGPGSPVVQAPPDNGSLPASGVSPAVEQSGRTPVALGPDGEAPSPRGSTPTPESQRSAAASSRQLPFTGADLPLMALLGATALAAGVVLRRGPAAR